MSQQIPVSEWKEHLCGRVITDVDVKEPSFFQRGCVMLTLYEPDTKKSFLFELSLNRW
jgi:hypothetical protein